MSDWSTEPHTSRYESGDSENIFAQYPWLENFSPRNRILKGRSYEIAKRAMDLSIVILSAPAWLFVLGLCALLIKREEPDGTIIFWQERTGRGGRRFRMYKEVCKNKIPFLKWSGRIGRQKG